MNYLFLRCPDKVSIFSNIKPSKTQKMNSLPRSPRIENVLGGAPKSFWGGLAPPGPPLATALVTSLSAFLLPNVGHNLETGLKNSQILLNDLEIPRF